MKPLEAKAVTDRLTGTPADPQDRPQQAAMPSVISLHVHLPSSPSSGFAENIKPPVKKAKKPTVSTG